MRMSPPLPATVERRRFHRRFRAKHMAILVPNVERLRALMVLCILSYPPGVAMAQDRALAEPASGRILDLRYNGKGLDAELTNVPLRDVAKALVMKTGVRITLNDPAIADQPISARIRGGSLEQGLKIILKGFSYALVVSSQGHTAVVLSTAPRRRDVPGIVDSVRAIGVGEVHASSSASNATGPQTLDEFRSLTPEPDHGAIEIPGNLDGTESRSANEAQRQEAMLQRALDVIESPHRQLYADAIEELGMLQDDRATEVLIKVAQQGPGRYLATEALSRVAAQRQFEDANAVTVLERLASDPDDDVRRSATQAVEQMRQTQLADRAR